MINIYQNIENGEYEAKIPHRWDFKTHTAFQLGLAKYKEKTADLHKKFRADLAECNGMTGHPKEEKIYDLANKWSSNRNEIAERYEELADLVK